MCVFACAVPISVEHPVFWSVSSLDWSSQGWLETEAVENGYENSVLAASLTN